MAISRRLLEVQSNRIEALLAHHKVKAYICGGSVTPRAVRFELLPSLGTKVSKIRSLAEEMAMTLGCRHARIYRRNDRICIEIARTKPAPLLLMDLYADLVDVPPATAILGMDDSGQPLLVRLSAPNVAHILIAGTTGSGKTALARTLLSSLAYFNRPMDLQLTLIDPKGRGFAPLADFSHAQGGIVSSITEAKERLMALVSEMERRDRNNSAKPTLVVAIDELADLIQVGGAPIQALLTRLTQRGREAGIHIVACTQKPTSALIGGAIKANFPVRLVGAVASRDEARYATGLKDSGAEKLAGRGDFLLITQGECVRFQAAWIEPSKLSTLARNS